jgi:hypothetical protein
LRYNAGKENYLYGYLFEWFENYKTGVFKREQIILQQVSRRAFSSYTLPLIQKYSSKNIEYYLKLDETRIVLFTRNMEAMLNLLPSKFDANSFFLKAEKTSFKEEADLIKLAQFLATI